MSAGHLNCYVLRGSWCEAVRGVMLGRAGSVCPLCRTAVLHSVGRPCKVSVSRTHRATL